MNNGKNKLSTSLAINYRNMNDEMSIKNEIETYSKTGTNCNTVLSTLLSFPLHDIDGDSSNPVSTSTISQIIKPYKYGCIEMVIGLYNSLKYQTKYIKEINEKQRIESGCDYSIAINISNYIATREYMAIGDDYNVVGRYFAGAVNSDLPMFFMFATYGDTCKLCITTDKKFVKKPKLLIDCWFDEWQKMNQ